MSYRTPTRPRQPAPPPGFRIPPKPSPAAAPSVRSINQMSVQELQERHSTNARILAQSTPTTSAFVQRLTDEQAAIQARLVELIGMEVIRNQLEQTTIKNEDVTMNIDPSPPPAPVPEPRPIAAKQRILAKFMSKTPKGEGSGFTFEEAVRIEQEAHALDAKRKAEIIEKRRRRGLPIKGEVLTREQQEARIWAFMNYKPTDSDLEDDDEEDSEDEDPSTWFVDDQDDGRKGQNLVEPDYEEYYSSVIRIDESRIPFSIPRDE
ncbi:hypothetical protein A0H81_03979 [Grifola frondosa]|uniref:Uncharacterized protein n=1 Tax=Grifola frondosa TaxID=5627 RepID=A0A1C7MIY3_GRIFR|nr:hypothetical protein A0H81_03979 [Grifola frondosa]